MVSTLVVQGKNNGQPSSLTTSKFSSAISTEEPAKLNFVQHLAPDRVSDNGMPGSFRYVWKIAYHYAMVTPTSYFIQIISTLVVQGKNNGQPSQK